ncbi:hypothetical protein PITC_073610 [Penicillium italicum]|uniref:Uncharacterized protein n=1 Tax=Penicillium italicum TaxID=40296 RepID=A0A0A2KCT6_PENIT|nr:hypothetical protein PITC_073610 [Penicillium italicum]
MPLAIAGLGDLACYLVEEFTVNSHDVMALSRRLKPRFEGLLKVDQVVVDYLVESTVNAISDCEAMISTILDFSEGFVDIHVALTEECKQSRIYKRFIPSELGVRSKNRHLKDFGPTFPINVANQTRVIPSTRSESLIVTNAWDMAKSLVALLESAKWDKYTYSTGEKTCWADISRTFTEKHPAISVSHQDVAEIEQEAMSCFDAKVHFRKVQDLLDAVDKDDQITV